MSKLSDLLTGEPASGELGRATYREGFDAAGGDVPAARKALLTAVTAAGSGVTGPIV